MKKRTAAFILCLITLLNLISIPAFATGNDSYADLTVTESRGASLMEALGIWDNAKGTDELNSVVTRGDWAKALSILIDSATNYDTSIYYFKDCKDDIYANSLAALEVFNGCEDGLFMPENAATVKTAYLTAFRVSGYERYLDLLGHSDYNYASLASQLGLDYSAKLNEAMTWREAMVLLYQIGNIKTYDITAAVGNQAIFRQNENKTVFSEWRNIYRRDKVRVTANRFTSLKSQDVTIREDQLVIGGVTYICDDKKAYSYIGQFVDIFYEDNGGDKTIVSIMPRDDISEPLVIEAGDFTFTDNVLTYDVKDSSGRPVRTKKLRLPSSTSVIYNQKYEYENVDSLFDIESGSLTLLTNGDGQYDAAIIKDIRNVNVLINDWATDTVYTDGEGSLKVLEIGPYSGKFIMLNSNMSDRSFSNTQIKTDDLLSVIMSKDGEYIEIYIAADKVSGVLDGVSKGNNYGVTIDGVWYPAIKSIKLPDGVNTGDNVTAYFDITGKVAKLAVDAGKKSGVLYAYVWNVYKDEFEETAAVKLYNENKEFIKLDFANRVRVNGTSEKKLDAISYFLDDNDNAKRQLIKYGVNDEGKINYIDLAAKSEANYEGDNTLYELSAMGSIEYSKADYSFGFKYPMGLGKTKVMIIPQFDKQGVIATDFDFITNVAALSPFASTTYPAIGLYNSDITSPEVDMVLYQPTEDFYGFLNFMLIDEVTNVVAGDGDEVLKITGVNNSRTTVTYYTTPDVAVKATSDGAFTANDTKLLSSGDLIAYNMNSENEVSHAVLIYDYETNTRHWGDAYSYNGFNARNTTLMSLGSIAKIHRNADVKNQYMFEITDLLGEGETAQGKPIVAHMPFFADKIKLLVYDSEKRSAKAYAGKIEDIIDAQGSGVGDKLFVASHGSLMFYPDLFVAWK